MFQGFQHFGFQAVVGQRQGMGFFILCLGVKGEKAGGRSKEGFTHGGQCDGDNILVGQDDGFIDVKGHPHIFIDDTFLDGDGFFRGGDVVEVVQIGILVVNLRFLGGIKVEAKGEFAVGDGRGWGLPLVGREHFERRSEIDIIKFSDGQVQVGVQVEVVPVEFFVGVLQFGDVDFRWGADGLWRLLVGAVIEKIGWVPRVEKDGALFFQPANLTVNGFDFDFVGQPLAAIVGIVADQGMALQNPLGVDGGDPLAGPVRFSVLIEDGDEEVGFFDDFLVEGTDQLEAQFALQGFLGTLVVIFTGQGPVFPLNVVNLKNEIVAGSFIPFRSECGGHGGVVERGGEGAGGIVIVLNQVFHGDGPLKMPQRTRSLHGGEMDEHLQQRGTPRPFLGLYVKGDGSVEESVLNRHHLFRRGNIEISSRRGDFFHEGECHFEAALSEGFLDGFPIQTDPLEGGPDGDIVAEGIDLKAG